MPTVRVNYEDGGEWLITNCEVVIPIWTLGGMSAEEIGHRVLKLIPNVRTIQDRINDCPWNMDTWENLEKHLVAVDEQRALREQARQRSKKLRKELQKEYDRVFAALVERDGRHCQCCGAVEALRIDHIIALINWGTNDLINLRLLCVSCNSKKGDRE